MRWFAADSVADRIRVNSFPALPWEWFYRDALALDCRGYGPGGREGRRTIDPCDDAERRQQVEDAALSRALKRGARDWQGSTSQSAGIRCAFGMPN
jgi:hypothetical protein